MKSSAVFILSILLSIANLAPSVILLTRYEKTAIAIDFNEEEKQETKKEINEKNFILDKNIGYLENLQNEIVAISHLCIESEYAASLAIFLPPPKGNL